MDNYDSLKSIIIDYSELSEEYKTVIIINTFDEFIYSMQMESSAIESSLIETLESISSSMEALAPNIRSIDKIEQNESKLKDDVESFEIARKEAKVAKDNFNMIKEKRYAAFMDAFRHISEKIQSIYQELTKSSIIPNGGVAYITVENTEEPYLDGIRYLAMPPLKRFRDMEQLSGGEKTMAALALVFAIQRYA